MIDEDYPFLENNENENWLSKMFKNQFYIDLTDMDQTNLNKLKELVHKEIIVIIKLMRHIIKNQLEDLVHLIIV